ncbi:GTPase activating protein, putative [Trypanosoma brucei brucei TREU927]|uniref:GTPase activating protein, putative n=1 Tax=Trypanosoma brucei brucei (strain 927/4 GUTat10.1) TaxID=185431 RepID=Q38A97_TRYB2|nr:GTPase activating protein, putative [Trypanosoma brucei brucei TREU927]EAN78273.1 GTPase activating protein, putative [Trypanosoma brucei brucei TREU927]
MSDGGNVLGRPGDCNNCIETAKSNFHCSASTDASAAQNVPVPVPDPGLNATVGADSVLAPPVGTDEQDDDSSVESASVSASGNPENEENLLVDEFGFIIDEEEHDRVQRYIRGIDGKRVARREVKWQKMQANWESMSKKRRSKVKSRCRKGIPSSFRGAAWQLLIGSYLEMLNPGNEGTYDCLRLKDISDEGLKGTISRDLPRTFPKHVLFREEGGIGQTFLRNVLHAYANIDPEVGYVQGMAFVVGALYTQMTEEETFWALHTLMNGEKYRLREMYKPGFPMLHKLFYQLQRLMAKLLPNLYEHFEELGVHPTYYASRWFMTLFVYDFNFRAVLRIWDIFLSEGWKIIFRIAIVLLKLEERRLLAMSFEEIIFATKTLEQGKDPDELIRRAHGVRFKTAELEAFAREYELNKREGQV